MKHSVFFFFKSFRKTVPKLERKKILWNAACEAFPLQVKTDLRYDRIEVTMAGKPYLPDNHLFFSFSDTAANDYFVSVSLAVTAGGVIGIDTEYFRIHANALRTAKHFFHHDEANILQIYAEQPALQSQIFFELWTKKEAYAKYTGAGLGRELLRASLRSENGNHFFPEINAHLQTISLPLSENLSPRRLVASFCMREDFTVKSFFL